MIIQKWSHLYFIATIFIVLPVVEVQPLLATQLIDNTIYGELLQKYVINGKVNYTGLKSEESRLDSYLGQLASIDPDKLSYHQRFAFYINAYNAWTLKLILSHYPGISSIKDIGSFFSSPWKKDFVRINGAKVTLDHIEHDILRPEFKDPRVHFAINCAAISCPPLANFPFDANHLDRQLETRTRAFINTPKSNYLKGDILWVSRIFKWFGEDFNDKIYDFVLSYAQGDFKRRLAAKKGQIKVKYLDYDWSLNGS
jgi:hypothetical protein